MQQTYIHRISEFYCNNKMMFKKNTVESKSRSKSPQSLSKPQLRKNKTEKDLLKKSEEPKKHVIGKTNLMLGMKKVSDPQINIKKTQSPKWSNNFRKPLQKWSPNVRSDKQFKRIQKQVMFQRPKIVKGKNDSYIQLQEKLKNLQYKLQSLKNNLIRQEKPQIKKIKNSKPKSKSKSKNKVEKSQSEAINKKLLAFNQSSQEQKNQSFTLQEKVLNNYITQVKPHLSSKITKQHKHQIQQLNQSIITDPYYVGLLIKNINIKDQQNFARDHISQALGVMNHLKSVKKPTDQQLEPQKIKIRNQKKYENKKTIIFDLDETLIHCNEEQGECDVKLPIIFPTGQKIDAGINIRPYAKQILINLSKRFQILVFTASHSCYANVVMDYLDPQKKYVAQRLYRDQCYQTGGMYIKDLRVISNRSLQNMVLIDNAAYSYFFQVNNGIPIIPFYDSKADIELKTLEKFLIENIEDCKDVREVLRQHFKLEKYWDYPNVDKLIEELYVKNN